LSYLQIIIQMRGREPFELPIHYNNLIQGMIYGAIDPHLAAFLHESGYLAEQRVFRLFTFSRLTGACRICKESSSIRFEKDVALTIASPVKEFCHSLVSGLLTSGSIFLGKNTLQVQDVSLRVPKPSAEKTLVQALSPVTIYSTLLRPDGRKYTYYYQPGEPDYERLIKENLLRKFRAFLARSPESEDLSIEPSGSQRLSVITYKGNIVKGYSGRLVLAGSGELIQMALDAGLGGKNSQGFGCIELVP